MTDAPAKGRKRRRDWKPKFLAAFAKEGTVSRACAVAKISRKTAYAERQRDEDFALAWHELEEEIVEKLEREGVRRALEGSDRLVEFFLKARRPDIYRETTRHEHSGPNGKPLQITVTDLMREADADKAEA